MDNGSKDFCEDFYRLLRGSEFERYPNIEVPSIDKTFRTKYRVSRDSRGYKVLFILLQGPNVL